MPRRVQLQTTPFAKPQKNTGCVVSKEKMSKKAAEACSTLQTFFDDAMAKKLQAKARGNQSNDALESTFTKKKVQIPIPRSLSAIVHGSQHNSFDYGKREGSPIECPPPLSRRRTDVDIDGVPYMDACQANSDLLNSTIALDNLGTMENPIIVDDESNPHNPQVDGDEMSRLSTLALCGSPHTNEKTFTLKNPKEAMEHKDVAEFDGSLLERRWLNGAMESDAQLDSFKDESCTDGGDIKSPNARPYTPPVIPTPRNLCEHFQQDPTVLCLFELGPSRYLKINYWRNEVYAHVRDFIHSNDKLYPSQNGISLTLQQYLELQNLQGEINMRILQCKTGIPVDSRFNLGGNKWLSIHHRYFFILYSTTISKLLFITLLT